MYSQGQKKPVIKADVADQHDSQHPGQTFGTINWNKSLCVCEAKSSRLLISPSGSALPLHKALFFSFYRHPTKMSPQNDITAEEHLTINEIKLAEHLGIRIEHQLCSCLLRGTAYCTKEATPISYTAERKTAEMSVAVMVQDAENRA